MKNRIRHISETDISAIEEQYAENSCILKLDGRRIQTESDWLYSMAELFMFPVYTENGNIPWFRGAFEKHGEHRACIPSRQTSAEAPVAALTVCPFCAEK